jgi:hypothetical protein
MGGAENGRIKLSSTRAPLPVSRHTRRRNQLNTMRLTRWDVAGMA